MLILQWKVKDIFLFWYSFSRLLIMIFLMFRDPVCKGKDIVLDGFSLYWLLISLTRLIFKMRLLCQDMVLTDKISEYSWHICLIYTIFVLIRYFSTCIINNATDYGLWTMVFGFVIVIRQLTKEKSYFKKDRVVA